MRVLVACEFSGVVRDAFLAIGHDAWSCDLLPTESVGPHFQGDVRLLLEGWVPIFMGEHELCPACEDEFLCEFHGQHYADCFCLGPMQDGVEYKTENGILFGRPIDNPRWDMMIAHPPCTYLSSSGLHWNKRIEGREEKTKEALEFVQLLLDAPIDRIALENPVGKISTAIKPPTQIINPYQFGENAAKRTGLWLKNLPPLVPTEIVPPKIVNGKKRWANQTVGGQNKLGSKVKNRGKIRSVTYRKIAEAMATQWGNL